MTEQSRIMGPTPARRRSLLERAQDSFGQDRFIPAPMPRQLAEPRRPQWRKPAGQAEAVAAAPAQVPWAEPVAGAAPTIGDAADVLTAADGRQRAHSHAAIAAAPPRIDFDGDPQPIGRTLLRDAGMIVPDGPVTALFEEFRIVRRQVLLAARDAQRRMAGGAAQRLLVCSPLPGDGKTFTAVNLALAIATEKDTEVVLVDADFAKPSIMGLLGLSGGPGLMDALADPAIRVEDCVIPTDIDRLSVLPAGHRTATDSEYLASSRTGAVLDRLTQGAPGRIVIFDSPPVLAASPAADLAKHVAQALMVVRAGRTGQSAVEDAVSLLSACADIKLLLNDARFSPSGRRFGDYHAYGTEG